MHYGCAGGGGLGRRVSWVLPRTYRGVVIAANDISDFAPRRAVRVRCLKHMVIWVAGVLVFASARAQEFSSTLQQLNHRAFTRLEGAPSDLYALAQTADGMLWLGSQTGLTRFDGMKFINYPEQSDDPLPSTNVSALMSSPDGGLWIGFRLGGVCFLRNGHLTRYGAFEELPLGTVYRFAYDRDGSLLVATSGGLVQLRGQMLQKIAPDVIRKAVVDVLM